MANRHDQEVAPNAPRLYHIRVQSHVRPQWSAWFAGLAMTWEDDGQTLLAGPVIDQAALHGILSKVRDLGLPLLSVECVTPDQTDAAADDHV